MEIFKPVEIREYYINRITSEMSDYFYDRIFKPIFDILDDKTVLNDKNALMQAIKSGKIYYKDGAFRTTDKFTNEISKTLEKMGAKFKNGAYYIARTAIPIEYVQAMAITNALTSAKLALIGKFLDSYQFSKNELAPYISIMAKEMFKTLEKDIVKSMVEKKIPVISLDIVKPKPRIIPDKKVKDIRKYWKEADKKGIELYKKIEEAKKNGKDVSELEKQFNEQNKSAFENAPKIEIDDEKLDWQSRKIAEDYTYNMQYWVSKWEAKDIVKMRQDVLDMVKSGARIPEIQAYFEKRWKIAKDKAAFLALNESHLAASVIKKTDYMKIGCTRFKWGKSNSLEKRELHKKYYDHIFDFDDPPIIDERTGQKGLPRQIWNCRCHMLIIVPSLDEQLKAKEKIAKEQELYRRIKNAIQFNQQFDNNVIRYRRFGQKGQAL